MQNYTSYLYLETECCARVCCGWRTPPTAQSNRFQPFHDSGR